MLFRSEVCGGQSCGIRSPGNSFFPLSKNNNTRDLYRGIIDMKKGYQPRTRIVQDEKGDLVADSHSIMARWRNYFSQILNVHGFSDVRQAEIHSA